MVTLAFRSTKGREPWILPMDSLVLLNQVLLVGLLLSGDLGQEIKLRWLAFHGLFTGGLLFLLWQAREMENPFLTFLRETYPLSTMLVFYRECGVLIHSIYPGNLDERLLALDLDFGGIGPAVWNLQSFHTPPRWVTEFFNIGYAFYFFLLPLAALVIYFRAKKSRLRAFMFTLTLTFYLHYLFFILFPAHSPRYFMPGLREPLPGYLITDWLKGVVDGNAFPGASFPSSHIATAVVGLMVLPYLGKWKFPVLSLSFLLFCGTVYGRYHYFVDVLAGLAVGLLCLFLGPWLERVWPFTFDEKGIVRGRQREAVDRG